MGRRSTVRGVKLPGRLRFVNQFMRNWGSGYSPTGAPKRPERPLFEIRSRHVRLVSATNDITFHVNGLGRALGRGYSA